MVSWARLPTLKLGTPQPVAGESQYQEVLERVALGRNGKGTRIRLFTAMLVLEPDNPHDNNAVRVVCAGETIGYVPGDSAPRYCAVVQRLARSGQSATCRAELIGGWDRGNDDRGSIGVVLHVGPRPTVWSDKVPFLPKSPWYDELDVVPLAGLAPEKNPPDRAIVTLASAHGAIAVRHGQTWVGHIVGRPDIVAFVERIAGLGLPTTAEFRTRQGRPVIPLADPDVTGDLIHAHGARSLKLVRRVVQPTGRWACDRCCRLWIHRRPPPNSWFDLDLSDDELPHVCPSCWSYAFTYPY